jgi:protein ImuB
MVYACLYAPDFPVQALIRVEEELRHQAVAVLDGALPLLTIIAMNSKARQTGIDFGMTKAQAELFDVKLRRRGLAQEDSAHQALLDCAHAFSPRVEDTGFRHSRKPADSQTVSAHGGLGDTVILDIAGLDRLHGPPQSIGRALRQLAGRLGLEVNVGIAANPEAATLAARGRTGVTVIPAGSEPEFLGPLPIDLLPLLPEQQETFQAWGIRTLQALAALPEIGLIERFGQEGHRLQILARGADRRPLVPAEPELKFEESMELEEPAGFLEPLAFILGRLLNPLCSRLAARNLAASEIRLALELEPPHPSVRLDHTRQAGEKRAALFHRSTLRLPVPMRDSRTLLKLLQLNLEARPPNAPVKKVELAAGAARPRTIQNKLFSPQVPEPGRMEMTLARIAVIVGENRAGSPVLCNTHRPGAFQMKPFVLPDLEEPARRPRPKQRGNGLKPSLFSSLAHPPNVEKSPAVKPGPQDAAAEKNVRARADADSGTCTEANRFALPRSVLRRFRPALAAQVSLRNGVPAFVTFQNQKHRVIEMAGPWRSSGDWWSESPWARDEWDVTLAPKTGAARRHHTLTVVASREFTVYRLYQDFQNRNWFVEGVYD